MSVGDLSPIPRPRRVPAPQNDAAVAAVALASGLDRESATLLAQDICGVLDVFLSHGISVLYTADTPEPWWIYGDADSPTNTAVLDYLDRFDLSVDEDRDRSRPARVALMMGDMAELARHLGLPAEDLELSPPTTVEAISDGLPDRWRPADHDTDAWLRLHDGVDAWFRTARHRYRSVGLESAFDAWLVANVEVLSEHGYEAEVHATQARVLGRRRIDVLCRIRETTEFARAGDWLVVENKARPAISEDVDQLADYVAGVRDEYAHDGETVHGLLIADGIRRAVLDRLHSEQMHGLFLADLGYLEHLDDVR